MNNKKNGSIMPMQRSIMGEPLRGFSDTEILAIVLNTGTRGTDVMSLSQLLYNTFGGLPALARAGVRELAALKGIGLKKAVSIQAAVELGRRCLSDNLSLSGLNSPEEVWRLLRSDIAGLMIEEFRVLILNNKNILLRRIVISQGTVTQTLVHPREVFRDAIREGGTGIILAHNHPSGVLHPSSEDLKTTERLVEAGELIGIPVIDHVILTTNAYLSLREAGYMS